MYIAHMDDTTDRPRTKLFISKGTPIDDAFTLWLAPRLEAFGYEVFADILNLELGDSWRSKLTKTLHDEAVKMLLCCSDETLRREGVMQEIGIGSQLTKELNDPNFILPLKMRAFKPVFGTVDLQYYDFENGWADGLDKLLKALERQNVPKALEPRVQPEWAAHFRRRAINLVREPEVLTSNWLRIMSIPDEIRYVAPNGSVSTQLMKDVIRGFRYPFVPYGEGFITFANISDFDEHFAPVTSFMCRNETDFSSFYKSGLDTIGIADKEARNMLVNLLRQAWELHCKKEGFLAHQFANGLAQIVSADKIELGKRVPWGKQGQRRNSMLRNTARGKVWEYGVSARSSLFPFPHYRLKSRVLFSEQDENGQIKSIDNHRVQHRLRRSIAGMWRNKAWHGRLMAFMELLAGDSPYVALSVGSEASILVDAMPIQATSPVTARQTNMQDEDAEETDITTLDGHFDLEET